MSKVRESERLRAPLMYAFRAAARAGDAKKKVDIREEGERVIAQRRASTTRRRSLSDMALRNLLAEDVANLLNTINMESDSGEMLDGLPNARKSILNYGLPDLASRTIDEKRRIDMIRGEITDALMQYEPRLISRTIKILRDEENEDDLSIRFVVHSDMRADPMPTSVEFVTEVELASGEIKIDRM